MVKEDKKNVRGIQIRDFNVRTFPSRDQKYPLVHVFKAANMIYVGK
jgi:hypothetical protein